MEGKTIRLRVVTTAGEVLHQQVSYVRMASPKGSFGVLPEHAPMLAAVVPCDIVYDDDEGRHSCPFGGGVAEISGDAVTVLG